MRTIVIILNGEGLRAERLASVLSNEAIIIAADGGANYCVQHNIRPHYIIGDLDSIQIAQDKVLPKSKLLHLADQYSTDLQKAMKLAKDLHGDRWIILNATGKRSDHALANILFLAEQSKNIDLQIIDNFGRLRFLLPGKHTFHRPRGLVFSLMALQPISGLTLEGVQYPLTGADFPSFFVGISNVVQQDPFTIAFDSGQLIMYEVESGV